MSTVMNEEGIREKLEEEILSSLENLSGLAPGSEEYKEAINGIDKLYRLGIDDAKAEVEANEKISSREDQTNIRSRELELREKEIELRDREAEMDKEVKDKEAKREIAKTAVNASISIASLVTSVVMITKGFEFEETGCLKSTTFRNLFQKVFKKQ